MISDWRSGSGGSLAGAVGINGAADVPNEKLRLVMASAGWARWTPVNLAAIPAHLIGGAGALYANKGRVATQRGVGATTVAKLALTEAALAVTPIAGCRATSCRTRAWSRSRRHRTVCATPADVAKAQRQLKVCQWAIPALTAGLAILKVAEGEQQRPSQVASGFLAKPARHRERS